MNFYDHETYLSPFTWRYGSPEMRAIWSEVHRRRLWRRVWVALATAQQAAGLLTAAELADIQAHQDEVDLARAHEIEAEIGHDLMAELRTFAAQCSLGGGRLHLGATSADIQDNADVLRTREALTLVHRRLLAVLDAFATQIERRADFPCMAYTHLQPAEPTTVGYRLCIYAQDLLADLRAVQRISAELRGKGFKGAVGTCASYTALLEGSGVTCQGMEQHALALLGLEAVPVSGQVYPRKQDTDVLHVLAGIAQSLHKFAFDLRVLQAAPYGEWREPFGERQVGSSAMPFKRNPVTAEKICSLARFVAALPRVAWDNAAGSLLERTLDDSANRRLILPGAFLAVDEMLLSARRIVAGLVVSEGAVTRNLATYGVFAATERLLMTLVRAGADRQVMHERIRTHSMAAWAAVERGEANPLVELLCADEAIAAYLSPAQVREALDARGHVGDAPRRCRAFLEELRTTLAGQARFVVAGKLWYNGDTYPRTFTRRKKAVHVELIAITRYLRGSGTPEELIEHAGRVCYRSEARGDASAFVQRRLREGHESIIEHASATFEISGISRACSHQLVRHRLASYSQESQRYVDASNAEFIVPESISADPEAKTLWDEFMAQARDAYRALRQWGIRKEDCRFLLPNATATRIIVTMNFRELLHMFRLRISPQAQWEIREVAVRMLELVCPIAPAVFGDLREELRTKYPSFFEDIG